MTVENNDLKLSKCIRFCLSLNDSFIKQEIASFGTSTSALKNTCRFKAELPNKFFFFCLFWKQKKKNEKKKNATEINN